MTRVWRIGITGGIGSGKSYVSRLLTAHFGVPIYDCDREARRLMTTSATIRQQLTALIGTDAYQSDGSLNKPVIARYLFASADHADRLGSIVNPAVKADFLHWTDTQSLPLVALESAILLDAALDDAIDTLLVVHAPFDLRLQRAVQRDGSTPEQVQQRMARQHDDDTLLAAADYVIYNDGRPLLPQLEQILQNLRQQVL